MNRKFLGITLLLLTMAVFAGVANADQITLGPSNAGYNVIFANTAGTTTIGFTNAGVLKGTGFWPNTSPNIGTYTFTFGAGTLPSLSLASTSNYNVTMGTAPLSFDFSFTGNNVQGIVTLQQVTAFNPKAPQVSGMLNVTSSSGPIANDFMVGPGAGVAFDVNLANINPAKGVDYVYQNSGTSVMGRLSSGEVVPTPEPTTLALFGTGILGLAGVIRRKAR